MEKLYRKSVVKTSPISVFNYGKESKTTNACKKPLEISYFKRNYEKGNLIFSFVPSPFLWTIL